jgi:hypothetical protein
MTDTTPPPRLSSEQEAKLAVLNREVTAEFEVRRRRELAQRRDAVSEERAARTGRGRVATKWLLWGASIALLLVLPFVVLIGGAVWLYRVHAVPIWFALACSGCVTGGLLTVYGARLSKKLTGKARLRFVGTRLALPAVAFYCLYTLLFLSAVNAKTEEVREYYRTVHPLLRVALSTAILADRDIVVTDARREPADYARMGLPTLDNSLHFVQESGYVHAVDLRTVGRAEWKNALMVAYFRLMGFKTLRHVGTADHLHVSLAPPGDMRR